MPAAFIVPRLLKMRVYRYCLSYFPRRFPPSDTPLSVVIPLAAKDIQRAVIAVRSIRRHVKHPIDRILIVGQDHDDIRRFCAAEHLIYINENDILPAAVLAGADNATKPIGWVRQQLIKLSVFEFTSADNVLVHDSDTYLLRDVAFCCGKRQLLFVADEYTKRYETLLFDFLGPITRYRRSFVAHSMLLQRGLLDSLNRHVVAQTGMSLIDAILHNIELANAGNLSEFEVYGNFLHSFHRGAFETRYWHNRKIAADNRLSLEQLEARFPRANSVSAHKH